MNWGCKASWASLIPPPIPSTLDPKSPILWTYWSFHLPLPTFIFSRSFSSLCVFFSLSLSLTVSLTLPLHVCPILILFTHPFSFSFFLLLFSSYVSVSVSLHLSYISSSTTSFPPHSPLPSYDSPYVNLPTLSISLSILLSFYISL